MESTTTSDITPKGKLSAKEAEKSARDAVIVSIGALVPQLLEIAANTDFGAYSTVASLVLAVAAPLINRLLNIWRV